MDCLKNWLEAHNFAACETSILCAVGAVVLTAVILNVLGGGSGGNAFNLLTKKRRSVMKYKGAAPADAVQRALTCAIHAPNHWVNEPWRFRLLGPQTKAKLSELNPGKKEVFDQVSHAMQIIACKTTLRE